MTSHELAKILLAGPDLMVTVRGYEGGVDEINKVWEPEILKLNVNHEGWMGDHEYERFPEEIKLDNSMRMAIHLSR